ncbi:hypothetical protein C8F04DRAFT_966692 [Mycena alexandri]|uniref:Uncharacterized protein n=1 Tax=Mycena alexandri TaxID=1745969 RepID=A0AAD6SEI6_9AGAR|nr:hypothetical protein C8F04DRAFT_966692 [Mycena alexandri]
MQLVCTVPLTVVVWLKLAVLVPLGPFDGKVGAVLQIAGESYFVTTNTDYIPVPPIRKNAKIVLRSDMRYGEDDPTLWPQNYSRFYSHLGAIRKKPAAGKKSAIGCMWWDPDAGDFISRETGRTLTRGLGLLKSSKVAKLATVIGQLLTEHAEVQSKEPQHDNILLGPLVYQIRRGLERLQTIPCTFSQAVALLRTLQRMFLEAEALLSYMRRYKPLMERTTAGPSPPPEQCVGVFTSNAVTAQEFAAAGLPFWFLRPAWTFTTQNILAVVKPLEPSDVLTLDAAPGATEFPTSIDTDGKMKVIHSCAQVDSWYKDPFKAAAEEEESEPSLAPDWGSSSPSGNRAQFRYEPCESNSPRPAASPSHASTPTPGPSTSPGRNFHILPRPAKRNPDAGGRDKFKALDLEREEMPSSIPSWADALCAVDRERGSLSKGFRYLFPEPALLVSSDSFERRQMLLYHFTMMEDGLIYRLGDPNGSHRLLSSQEWRDVLGGKSAPARARVTKASLRSLGLRDLLAPAFEACGITELTENFPAAPGSFPPITKHRAQEILWRIGETNFRYEFLALDRRASGREREEACRECLVGGMLMGMPIELSKQGLASLSLQTRHEYTMRIARLMRDWNPRPQFTSIARAAEKQEWSEVDMRQLEKEVAVHYTQTFYDIFGRAAVVPTRLVHEFGT